MKIEYSQWSSLRKYIWIGLLILFTIMIKPLVMQSPYAEFALPLEIGIYGLCLFVILTQYQGKWLRYSLLSIFFMLLAVYMAMPLIDGVNSNYIVLASIMMLMMLCFAQFIYVFERHEWSYSGLYLFLWHNVSMLISAIFLSAVILFVLWCWQELFSLLGVSEFQVLFFHTHFLYLLMPLVFVGGLYINQHIKKLPVFFADMACHYSRIILPMLTVIAAVYVLNFDINSQFVSLTSTAKINVYHSLILFNVASLILVNLFFQAKGRVVVLIYEWMMNILLLCTLMLSALNFYIYIDIYKFSIMFIELKIINIFLFLYSATYVLCIAKESKIYLSQLPRVNVVLSILFIIIMIALAIYKRLAL